MKSGFYKLPSAGPFGDRLYVLHNKCIVQGKQARVKNADLRHPSCTVVMQKRKFAPSVLSVLRFSSTTFLYEILFRLSRMLKLTFGSRLNINTHALSSYQLQ